MKDRLKIIREKILRKEKLTDKERIEWCKLECEYNEKYEFIFNKRFGGIC